MPNVKNERILCLFSRKEDEDIFNLLFLGKEGAGHSKRADGGVSYGRNAFQITGYKGRVRSPLTSLRRQVEVADREKASSASILPYPRWVLLGHYFLSPSWQPLRSSSPP